MRVTKPSRRDLAAIVVFTVAGTSLGLWLLTRGHPPELRAAADVAAIAKVASIHWQRTGGPPRDLEALVAAELLQIISDPWNRPYRLGPSGDGLWVASAGPDGDFGTGDDIAAWLPRPE